uniref:RNase H type-1 domain-containing protein n=1 Tax=Mycena chlorophos TaxID=658473 RepID=A0ABQ0LBQ5_MYCCL|nr:predicted protein [Mycena chlorophos]
MDIILSSLTPDLHGLIPTTVREAYFAQLLQENTPDSDSEEEDEEEQGPRTAPRRQRPARRPELTTDDRVATQEILAALPNEKLNGLLALYYSQGVYSEFVPFPFLQLGRVSHLRRARAWICQYGPGIARAGALEWPRVACAELLKEAAFLSLTRVKLCAVEWAVLAPGGAPFTQLFGDSFGMELRVSSQRSGSPVPAIAPAADDSPHAERFNPVIGLQVEDTALPAPAAIVKRIKKGEVPPLFYLTNEYCARGSTSQSADLDRQLVVDGEALHTVSKELSFERDKSLTHVQVDAAYDRLFGVMMQCKLWENLLPRWRVHRDFVLKPSNSADDWALYVTYDAEVRRLANSLRFDPGTKQQKLWDAALASHAKARTAALVDAELQKLRAAPKPETASSSSRSRSFRTSESRTSPGPERTEKIRCFKCGSRESGHGVGKCTATTTPRGTATFLTIDPRTGVHVDRHGDRMLAPFAEATSIPPSAAVASEFFPVVTPLRADAWEAALRAVGLLEGFADVVQGLREGFHFGIDIQLTHSFLPPNRKSALEHPEVIDEYVETERRAKRYTGPFNPRRFIHIAGDVRSCPLGVTPKAGEVNKWRMVQDFSYPYDDPDMASLNDGIDSDKFPCKWGTFSEMLLMVMDAPPGTQAATLDVDAAFRRVPIHPSQQRFFVVLWRDLLYLDHQPYRYTYDLADILAFSSPLGWPWKDSKTRPFASVFKYVGFLWDLEQKTVQLPESKKARYLEKLAPWVKGAKFTRKEAESVNGTLVHCSLAVPEGRSRLPAISAFASSFDPTKHFSRHTPNGTVLADIGWWCDQLRLSFCGSELVRPPRQSPLPFFVDASTSHGIGVVFDSVWMSWRLLPGWDADSRSIGWAEMLAIEFGLRLAVHRGYSDIHFHVRSDNQGVIGALEAGKSRNSEQNRVLRRIVSLLCTHALWLTTSYVPSVENLADGPSRGIGLPAPGYSRVRSSFAIPYCVSSLISEN